MQVPVFRYTLLRSVYQRETGPRTRTRSFGQIGVCNRCLAEQARMSLIAQQRVQKP